MKLLPKYSQFFLQVTVLFSTFIRFVLNILLILLCVALIVGVYKSGLDLYQSLDKPLESILQKMLLDTVFIVALVEIAITVLGYLKDGQVHVRYIVDTILIIMLNEIVTLWFKHPKLEDMIGISIIVLSLALIRISVTRFAPQNQNIEP